MINDITIFKNVFSIILLSVTFNSFSQDISGNKPDERLRYSESSEIKVVYNDSLNKFHTHQIPPAIFVNGEFTGSWNVLKLINPDQIESLNVEKEKFEINGTEYEGKISIDMKPGYSPSLLTLKELSTKYLTLNGNPVIYQIDEKVIGENGDQSLVDENFILKIILDPIRTSENNIEINLVRLITKTPENIKEANTIRIRGTEK